MEWCNIISLHAIFDNKSRVQILEVFQPEDRRFRSCVQIWLKRDKGLFYVFFQNMT